MNKWKDLILKLLFPNILIFLLFFIIGFGSVIYIFINNLSSSWFAYISYVLSAYALIITVSRSVVLIRKINKNLHNNKYTNRLLTDKVLKSNINLFSGTFFNMIYGIFKMIVGYLYKSIWFGSTGIYYLVLGFMKLSLTKHVIKRSNLNIQNKQYRNIGILMFILNITMVGLIILNIKKESNISYPDYVVITQAAYTFYILTFAIINIIKYRKNYTPIIEASKAINLVAAIMSLFILQVALINQFGGDSLFKYIINTITGSFTSIITITVAIFMIIKSKKIKED
ncbi:MAG: hypothetical protein IJZ46_05985 [Bacilli bacterium]|nr:hypothetical protein [Bacilli bacterium]